MIGNGAAGDPLDGLDLPADLITGEAVVLELRPASFATRGLALLLDLLIQGVAGVLVIILLSVTLDGLDQASASAVVLVAVIAVVIGIPATIETLTRGRSAGKYAAGLRVVRDDGGPIRFRHALIRALLGVFEFYITSFSAAAICSLANRRGKRLGDLLAGTYVVRERGAAMQPPVLMPPELVWWAYGADIGRIPDRLSVAVRQFLNRVNGLHPGSRQRLGLELAGQLAAYVAPPPPAGVHPERFLAAVLAERRRRDLDRLVREQQAQRERAERRHRASPLSSASTRLIGEE